MGKQDSKVMTKQLQLKKPVVLVGLMGAGKTTIGRRLAQQLDLEFIDSDQEICEAAGCDISDIFDIYGEDVFRDLEKRVMQRLLGKKACIIATGGGAFIQDHIRKQILEKSTAIWLRADLEVLLERVSRRDTRPLLRTGDRTTIMQKLMDERYPTYSEAHLAVDSNEGSHECVVDAIIEELYVWKKG